MSAIDVDQLLSEISPEAPCGADVEFDPAYFELEKLAQGTPESVMGDEVKPAQDPEWPDVKKAAVELFTKTRDLRVAMILATALLQVDGLAGFLDGVTIIKGFVEKLWENFYPKLDPDDNNDPMIRLNILKGFDGDGSAADLYKFKQRLREAILTNSQQRIGRFSYRDIQIATGEVPPPPAKDAQDAKPADMKLINAAFEDTTAEDLQATHASLTGITEGIDALDAAIAEKCGAGTGPDMTPIKEVVGLLTKAIAEQLAKRGIGEAPAASDGEGASGGGGYSGGGGGGVALDGQIASRDDVVRVLDKICEYYERFEPGSPVPIFMRRAKKLVTMNFIELMKELAPEAMSKIEIYSGPTEAAAPAPAENP